MEIEGYQQMTREDEKQKAHNSQQEIQIDDNI